MAPVTAGLVSLLLLVVAVPRAALGCVEFGNPIEKRGGADTSKNTLSLNVGMPFATSGDIYAWNFFSATAGVVDLQVWRADGSDKWKLACVDSVVAKGTGKETFPGSCSYAPKDVIGIDVPGLGVVTWDSSGAPGADSHGGVDQFYKTAPKPGGTMQGCTRPSAAAAATSGDDGNHTKRRLQDGSPCVSLPTRLYSVSVTTGCLGWGWPFVMILLGASLSYALGFAVYGHKMHGKPLVSMEAIPHREQWLGLFALVVDGLTLSAHQLGRLIAMARGQPPPPPFEQQLSGSRTVAGLGDALLGGGASTDTAAAECIGGGGKAKADGGRVKRESFQSLPGVRSPAAERAKAEEKEAAAAAAAARDVPAVTARAPSV